MARLNDAPPSFESLEALKRRFTRQNRDLARTNSSQSLRIRNLETEISRLLSENISLREATIASSEECERYRRQNVLGEEILELKGRLLRRLEQVNTLVEEMGALPEKAVRRERENRRRTSGVGVSGEVRSPNERDWRNRQTLAGVLGGEGEGRLPVIVEDKLYPRRTLEPLEIKNLVNDAEQDGKESESPELGPPPMAHFDVNAEPIDFTKETARSPENGQQEGDLLHLPNNLETRRKRRTSSLLRNITGHDELRDEEKPSLFKSGAKRKLDISELEEIAAQATSGSETEEFVFQRRPALKPASNRKSSRFSRPNTLQGEIIIPSNGAASPKKEKQEERKALAPKSTNSPAKRPMAEGSKPEIKNVDTSRRKDNSKQPNQADTSERLPSRRGPITTNPTRQATSILPTKAPSQSADSLPSDIPPKTPFLPSDVLSPLSSNPTSTSSHKTAPSEAAILASVEDVLNGSLGRASRRAKAAVSYAEPNLRDKMRRPGREMVGAVEGIDFKKRDGSIGGVLSRSTSEDVEARIKLEEREGEGERWRGLPMVKGKEEQGSPLSEKKAHSQTHSQVQRQPGREDGGKVEREGERDRSAAIRRHAQARREQKALLANTVQNSSGVNVGGNEEQALNEAVEKLSIFDELRSSPAMLTDGATPTGGATSESIKIRERQHPPSSTDGVLGTSMVKRRAPSTSTSTAKDNASGREADGGGGGGGGRRHSTAPSSSTTTLPTSNPSAGSSDPGIATRNPLPHMVRSRSTAVGLGEKALDKERANGGAGGLKRSVSVAAIKERQQQRQTHAQREVVADSEEASVNVSTRGQSERVATRRRSMMV